MSKAISAATLIGAALPLSGMEMAALTQPAATGCRDPGSHSA